MHTYNFRYTYGNTSTNDWPFALKAQTRQQQIHEYCSLSSNNTMNIWLTNDHHVNIANRWHRLAINKWILLVATAFLVAGSSLTFWIPPFASTSSYSTAIQSTGLLTYGSFQLTHISRDNHAVHRKLIEPQWRPKRRPNIITALTTLPQGWVSVRKHQCTTAITTM